MEIHVNSGTECHEFEPPNNKYHMPPQLNLIWPQSGHLHGVLNQYEDVDGLDIYEPLLGSKCANGNKGRKYEFN